MVAEVVITESAALGAPPPPADSVGLASYAFDSHAIKHYVDPATGFVTTDGGLPRPPAPIDPPQPYAISYRAIVPKPGLQQKSGHTLPTRRGCAQKIRTLAQCFKLAT